MNSFSSKRLALLLAVPFVAASAATAQTVTIDTGTPIGPQIARAGWDIKAWPLRLNSASEARRLYRDVPANFLRIPFFATAHNEDGSVNTSAYSDELNAIRAVLNENPDVELYASLKLQGGNTYPDWVGQGTNDWPAETGRIFGNTVDRPNPELFSTMVTDYLSFLKDEGIAIDHLGLNNETEDALTAERYIATYDLLQPKLAAAGITGQYADFEYVGPDSFGIPTAERFVVDLSDAGRLDTLDYAASHYYPQHGSGSEGDWEDLSQKSGGLPLWHTEVHMPGNTAAVNEISQTVRDSLSVLFASFRNGVDSFVWWESPNTIDTIREVVKADIISTTLGATPVLTTPMYDGKGDPDGEALFQAFVDGNEVRLWIVNPDNQAITNLPVDLHGYALGSDITSVTYFAPDGDNNLAASDIGQLDITLDSDGLGFAIDEFAANTIAIVSFTLTTLAGDYNNDGTVDSADYSVWRDNLGAPAGTLPNDVDGGAIGTAQYQTFVANFGEVAPGQLSAQTTTVPEPSSILSLAIGVTGVMWRRRTS